MATLYIVGAVQALFFSILLVLKKQRQRADFFLSAFFLIIMLSLLFACSSTFKAYYTFPLMMPIVALVPLLYGPLLYFYVKELCVEKREKSGYYKHLIPIILFYLIMAPLFSNRILLLKSFTDRFVDLPLYVNFGISILYLSAPVYFIIILQCVRRYRNLSRIRSSEHSRINFFWLIHLVRGAIFLWSLEIGRIIYVNYLAQTNPVILNHAVKTGYVIFIFGMGIYGLRQRNIFVEEDDSKQKMRSSSGKTRKLPSNNESKLLEMRLLTYLDTEKPYLNPNLKLLDVAIALDIQPHVLSCIINENLNKNFLNLINGYRVEEAKNMLIINRYASQTILSIAYDCGFNSKTSFNRIFKEHTGLCPSMFIKIITIGP